MSDHQIPPMERRDATEPPFGTPGRRVVPCPIETPPRAASSNGQHIPWPQKDKSSTYGYNHLCFYGQGFMVMLLR